MIRSFMLRSSLLVLLFCVVVPVGIVNADEAETASGIRAVTGFSDVLRTHDHYVPITYLNESEVINGYPDGSFKPDNAINRAEVLKIILKGSGIDAPEDFGEVSFPDFRKTDWFARYVMKAKELGIAKGNDRDGTFAPGRQVNKAEFLKMLLLANKIVVPPLNEDEEAVAPDVPKDAWFAPYLSYAYKIGIVAGDANGNLAPSHLLSRGEVASMMYLLILIKKSEDTQFLLHRAESEMAQIEVYIAANKVPNAKYASELSVDLTQQAYRNMPDNEVVLGAAKLAKAYDWLVDSFILGVNKQYDEASEKANLAIDKATEAWEVNNATQPIARHIKDRAREILAQVGGTEN